MALHTPWRTPVSTQHLPCEAAIRPRFFLKALKVGLHGAVGGSLRAPFSPQRLPPRPRPGPASTTRGAAPAPREGRTRPRSRSLSRPRCRAGSGSGSSPGLARLSSARLGSAMSADPVVFVSAVRTAVGERPPAPSPPRGVPGAACGR